MQGIKKSYLQTKQKPCNHARTITVRVFLLPEILKGVNYMKTFAYCRVSSIDQNESRQLDAMAELKIPQINVYVDKQSGKDFLRPAWQEMTAEMKEGDLLYVHSIDRLGRDYDDIIKWWRTLTKDMGVDIVVLDMPLLNTQVHKDLLGTLIADLVLSLLSYVANAERDNIKKRQAEGIKSALARGVKFGRPIKQAPEDFGELVKLWEKKEISFEEILEQTGLKHTSFYSRLREHRGEPRAKRKPKQKKK